MFTRRNTESYCGYWLLVILALLVASGCLTGRLPSRIGALVPRSVVRSLVTSNFQRSSNFSWSGPVEKVTHRIQCSNLWPPNLLCDLLLHLMVTPSNRHQCPVWRFCASLSHKLAHTTREDLVRRLVFGAMDTNLAGGLDNPNRRRLESMARDPFMYDRDPSHDEDSEFGFGRGQHPDPNIDYSDGGIKSGIPIADPDQNDQLLTLRQVRRMDINDPNDVPDPYALGNTDRYGAQPPLVRERKRPRYTQIRQDPPKRMKRAY